MPKQKNESFSLVGHEVVPGERLQFDLPAAQLYTHTPLDMPVEIIHGEKPGPVLLVSAAIHGNELNGVEIIRRLRTIRALRFLRGTLILVPMVNLFGFIHQDRYLPDRRDLNRCFPGNSSGSLGSRVAHLFFQEIVRSSTHAIDLHTGALHRENLPQIRANLEDPNVKEMALGFSIPVIVNAGLIDGSLRGEASKVGIPIITYEAGEALRLDEKSIVAGVRGITSVMRTLGMLRARRTRTIKAEPYIARSFKWFRAVSDGLFRPMTKLGAKVNKGDILGVISSPFSSDETAIESTIEGIVIGMNKLPLVNEGEALFNVARFGEAEAVEGELAVLDSEIETDPLYDVQNIEDDDTV